MRDKKKIGISTTLIALMLAIGVINYLPLFKTPTIVIGQEEYPRYETFISDSWGSHANFDHWNPHAAGFDATYTGWSLVNEPLFWGNWVNGTVVPFLATGYEMSADAKTYTIRIRNDVYWNNGKKWGMDDIMYTLNVSSRFRGLTTYGWYQTNIERYEKVDDLTFRLVLKEPNAHFISTVGFGGGPIYIMPKHVYEKYEDPSKATNKEHVWTGPYNLTYASADLFIWRKNPNYWGLSRGMFVNSPKYVIYRNIGTEEKQLMAISKNEIDMVYHEGGWWSTWQRVRVDNPLADLWYQYAVCQDSLVMPLHTYPSNLKEFRWAVSLAINRTKYIEIFGEGRSEMAQASIGPMANIGPSVQKWMPADMRVKYPYGEYNPQKAAQLLLSIGFTKGADGWWRDRNGTIAEFEIRYNWQPQETRLLQEMLAQFGIKLIPKELTWGVFQPWRNTGLVNPASWSYSWGSPACTTTDPYPIFNSLYGPNARPLGETGGANWLRFKNATFDEAFREWKLLPLESTRAMELYRKMYEIYVAELPNIPIYDKVYAVLVNNYYWTNWPTRLQSRPAFHSWEFAVTLMYLKPTGRGVPIPWYQQYAPYIGVAVAAAAVAAVWFLVLPRRQKAAK